MGRSRKDISAMPEDVKDVIGFALDTAQCGEKSASAKPLKGFRPSVLEIVDNFDGETYRAVYTVKLKGAIYVLHTFQKKSKKGIATPTKELDVIRTRLKEAAVHYNEHFKE